mgnify:FL=1
MNSFFSLCLILLHLSTYVTLQSRNHWLTAFIFRNFQTFHPLFYFFVFTRLLLCYTEDSLYNV